LHIYIYLIIFIDQSKCNVLAGRGRNILYPGGYVPFWSFFKVKSLYVNGIITIMI